MKKLAFWNRYASLNDHLFIEPNAPIGDDLLLPLNRLAEEAAKRGVECVSLGKCRERPEGVVFLDYPSDEGGGRELLRRLLGGRAGVPLYLVAFENATIVPENWEAANHLAFRKVFSWDHRLAGHGSGRYVTLNYAQDLPLAAYWARETKPRPGFCCMIAGNKASTDPRSIYPLRAEAIRAFSADDGFDLYGPGWDRALYPHWLGIVPPGTKRSTLRGYTFNLAFENARFPGYVTEKLFDAMIAGTIPVYLGAQDIWHRVDSACYVDASAFFDGAGHLDGAALLAYLRSISPEAIDFRRDAIRRWMTSRAADPYRIETFVSTLLDTVLGTP